jgi:hypothetical protein
MIMVGVIAISIFAFSTLALNHPPTLPPITGPTPTPTPIPITAPTQSPMVTSSTTQTSTLTSTTQPTATPQPTASPIPISTPTTPSPTPMPPPSLSTAWKIDFPLGTYVYSSIQTDDSEYVVTGYIRSNPNNYSQCNGWMAKFDSSGKILWSKAYGNNTFTSVKEGLKTSDGGFAMAGYSAVGGNGSDQRVWLGKTDSMGVLKWNQTYPFTGTAYLIIQMDDNGYLLAATSPSTIIRVDSSGNLQWSKTFSNYNFNSMMKCSDGSAVLAGGTGSNGILVKLDNEANIQWSLTYGINVLNQVMPSSDGGFVLTSCAGPNFWLIKTDSLGAVLWAQRYSNVSSATAVQTNDGYTIAGYYGVSSGLNSYSVLYRLMIKTDLNGTLLWEKTGFNVPDDITNLTILGITAISDNSYILFTYAANNGRFEPGNGVIFKITITPTT